MLEVVVAPFTDISFEKISETASISPNLPTQRRGGSMEEPLFHKSMSADFARASVVLARCRRLRCCLRNRYAERGPGAGQDPGRGEAD